MLNTLKKSSIYIGLSVMLALAACTTPTATTPSSNPSGTPTATETASIAGTVTKDGQAPGKNASVVLIMKKADTNEDAQIVRTKDNGEFSFAKVEKGNYRVAFTLATESERKASARIFYDPKDGYTSDYYSFVTTRNFDYDGDVKKTFQIPNYNVGWKSELAPFDKTFKSGEDITFSWAKASGAKSYNVLVQDDQFNQVSKTGELTDTSFVWSASDVADTLKAGQTYYFLVNVTFDTSSADATSPVLTYGGSALSKFSYSK